MAAFTDEQSKRLAEITGQPVPPAYLDWMRDYPADLASLTYAKLKDRIADHELHDDPKKVLRVNEMVREEDIWTGEDGDGPYPANHLAIGEDIGGDIVSIQLDDAALPVFRLLTSTARLVRVADNLDGYADQLRKKHGAKAR
jgi:hypothetical protein